MGDEDFVKYPIPGLFPQKMGCAGRFCFRHVAWELGSFMKFSNTAM